MKIGVSDASLYPESSACTAVKLVNFRLKSYNSIGALPILPALPHSGVVDPFSAKKYYVLALDFRLCAKFMIILLMIQRAVTFVCPSWLHILFSSSEVIRPSFFF